MDSKIIKIITIMFVWRTENPFFIKVGTYSKILFLFSLQNTLKFNYKLSMYFCKIKYYIMNSFYYVKYKSMNMFCESLMKQIDIKDDSYI